MADRISKKDELNLENLKAQINLVDQTHLAKKSDLQLQSYDKLSTEYKLRYNVMSDAEKSRRYITNGRKTKLTWDQVNEIRRKYQRFFYGKARLAEEYGVSVSVVFRILRGRSWKM